MNENVASQREAHRGKRYKISERYYYCHSLLLSSDFALAEGAQSGKLIFFVQKYLLFSLHRLVTKNQIPSPKIWI
jgi:hypothetical protein